MQDITHPEDWPRNLEAFRAETVAVISKKFGTVTTRQ
jgi:hypothetical protein